MEVRAILCVQYAAAVDFFFSSFCSLPMRARESLIRGDGNPSSFCTAQHKHAHAFE